MAILGPKGPKGMKKVNVSSFGAYKKKKGKSVGLIDTNLPWAFLLFAFFFCFFRYFLILVASREVDPAGGELQ